MNQSVIKALKILNLFSEETQELTLKEIATQSNLPKPTAYRLLQSLEEMGYIIGHDGRYSLGLKLLELGHLVSHQLDLRQLAKPLMTNLAQSINEAVHLVVLHGDHATYIEKVESRRALRLYTKVGKSAPLYKGSGPKLLLAHLPQTEQMRVLPDESLIEEVEQIRQQGYAMSVGEQDLDTTGLSYPIYNHSGNVVAALTVSGLSSHFEGDHLTFIKVETKKTADEISRCLGYAKKEGHS
ncbi:IclR family transcriptional regulator [Aquisalibacillus elongatus]|uniref:Glycerol operon regulatory protein n=1 Tax=Aquisalibacillus elongatus TaxID=485577 RepID=A0A3N5CBY6_9BACI|nr:IclR family transcriptional regulator [Aquisalibacillus elongatus]RPF54401.1 IclR family transcriptional regulator [Aquisalibacillus elongatus]